MSNNKLSFRMSGKIRLNRSIDKNRDFISPGGYEMVFNGKTIQFDFEDYQGGIDEKDPSGRTLWFEQRNPDYDTFTDLNKLTEDDLTHLEEIKEFYIYTGEPDETDLIPSEIVSITFSSENVNQTYDIHWQDPNWTESL